MTLCWCCNGKGFYMKAPCKWCDAGDDHRQCERGEPVKHECKVCKPPPTQTLQQAYRKAIDRSFL